MNKNHVSENDDDYVGLTMDAPTSINNNAKLLTNKITSAQKESCKFDYISTEEITRVGFFVFIFIIVFTIMFVFVENVVMIEHCSLLIAVFIRVYSAFRYAWIYAQIDRKERKREKLFTSVSKTHRIFTDKKTKKILPTHAW